MEYASHLDGKPFAYDPDTGVLVERAGFKDLCEKVVKIPFSAPKMDVHEVDIKERRLADWFKATMAYDGAQSYQSYQALSMWLFTRLLGWRREDVDALCRQVTREVRAQYCPLYHNL